MKLENYKVSGNEVWTGRIDNPNDPDSFRMHQVIQLLDLTKLEDLQTDLSEKNICFLGYCCDEGVKRNMGRTGAANGPDYIRKEYANLPVTFGDRAAIFDAGDIYCYDDNMEKAQEQLAAAVKIILEHKLFPIILGGGHELSLGNYTGIKNYFSEKKGEDQTVAIINFDAHLDMRPYENGGSSGTMFFQIAEKYFKDDDIFPYLCIGAQTYSNTKSLFKRADKLGAQYIQAKDITDSQYEKISAVIDKFTDKYEQLYITLCCDVFNSAYAPGVSATQPFGMNPEVVLIFLKQILRSQKVISIDIAEVSPRFDHDNHTAKLSAVIIYAIINVLTEL